MLYPAGAPAGGAAQARSTRHAVVLNVAVRVRGAPGGGAPNEFHTALDEDDVPWEAMVIKLPLGSGCFIPLLSFVFSDELLMKVVGLPNVSDPRSPVRYSMTYGMTSQLV